MPLAPRNLNELELTAIITNGNYMLAAMASASGFLPYHHVDVAGAIPTTAYLPAATTLATANAILNLIKAQHNLVHLPSAIAPVGDFGPAGAHVSVDTNLITAPDATITGVALDDLNAAIALWVDIKAKHNLHIAVDATVHPVKDTTNSIGTTAPTTLGTLYTATNAIRPIILAHWNACSPFLPIVPVSG